MEEQKYEYGMIGLGTMGWNFVLNMADNGFSVAGYDKDEEQVNSLNQAAEKENAKAFYRLESFITSLKQPRIILMLVPAGRIVDSVIHDLKPFLVKDDLLVDCGNSHFSDTSERIDRLARDGIYFMGVGVSGGETGARYGPSIMPGGALAAWDRTAPLLKAIAAKINGEPCVKYMGSGSAGHYVKMVHNGIEYAMMQMISEAYHMLSQVGGLSNAELSLVFENYNQSAIRSYLMEITAVIFTQKDDLTEQMLVDIILDKAHQKGTGAWTSQDSMKLSVPVPAIDAAVSQREMSTIKEQRIAAAKVLHTVKDKITVEHSGLITLLQDAMHFCMITTYAQGMSLLKEASLQYDYRINLADVASVWRAGCIIRSGMLEDITATFNADPSINNLMVSEVFSETLNKLQKHTRSVICTAVAAGIPVPVMMASLSYFDSYRNSWLPANLIQAQRDFFGAHTYERTDKAGNFHSDWKIKVN